MATCRIPTAHLLVSGLRPQPPHHSHTGVAAEISAHHLRNVVMESSSFFSGPGSYCTQLTACATEYSANVFSTTEFDCGSSALAVRSHNDCCSTGVWPSASTSYTTLRLWINYVLIKMAQLSATDKPSVILEPTLLTKSRILLRTYSITDVNNINIRRTGSLIVVAVALLCSCEAFGRSWRDEDEGTESAIAPPPTGTYGITQEDYECALD
ncbi:hypothetical protein BDY19DRAFT_1049265 [Irpex rosettiformis]|uniref:Uncharacterized protein n=1 Tax=Irpex rosettiformis TaxID=378272 RepID=A0ACB8TZP5_9APHY|nr:hypothetical protein BDY19DRAFT_1049265 [Irpex rosettiformis]